MRIASFCEACHNLQGWPHSALINMRFQSFRPPNWSLASDRWSHGPTVPQFMSACTTPYFECKFCITFHNITFTWLIGNVGIVVVVVLCLITTLLGQRWLSLWVNWAWVAKSNCVRVFSEWEGCASSLITLLDKIHTRKLNSFYEWSNEAAKCLPSSNKLLSKWCPCRLA